MHTAPLLAPRVIETSAPAPVRSGSEAPRRRRSLRAWLRPLGGLAILAVLVWRVGTGPFLAGLRTIDGWAIAAALGLGVLGTGCAGWRWSLVARGLGLRLPLRTAVADYYRSVFLNATLPGGVLGDVHRAVSHGRDAGDVGRGIRAVVWEKTAGQLVQVVLALALLLAVPSPVRAYMPLVAGVVLAALLGVVLLSWLWSGAGIARTRFAPAARVAQVLQTARTDIRDGLLARRNWPPIVFASVVGMAAHLATFLIVARTAGSTAPLSRLVPLTLLALLAMGLPANIGGFGPREGVAAWAFGAAGLSAAQGVTTAVVYGALVLVASLPGAAVLVVRRLSEPPAAGQPERPPLEGAHLG